MSIFVVSANTSLESLSIQFSSTTKGFGYFRASLGSFYNNTYRKKMRDDGQTQSKHVVIKAQINVKCSILLFALVINIDID
jgi:hypothetical protein